MIMPSLKLRRPNSGAKIRSTRHRRKQQSTRTEHQSTAGMQLGRELMPQTEQLAALMRRCPALVRQ